MGNNSTKQISTSNISDDSPINYTLSLLSKTPLNYFLNHIWNPPIDIGTTLNTTEFGNFTANFKEVPPPIPTEYWIPLYGVIISTVIGWSIPSIIRWANTKSTIRKLNHYHKSIDSIYDDAKLDENDIKSLDKLKNDITDAYSKGKIQHEHFNTLKEEISVSYEEIFSKKIDSLKSLGKEKDKNKLKIEKDITDAYSKGKINEIHYKLLKNEIADLINNKEEYYEY